MPRTEAPAQVMSGTKTTMPKSNHAVSNPACIFLNARRAMMEARTGSSIVATISTPTTLLSPSNSLNGSPTSTMKACVPVKRKDSFCRERIRNHISGEGQMPSLP